jgi:hypothetical protein
MTATTVSAKYEGAVFGVANNDLRSASQAYPFDLKFGMLTLNDETDATDTVTVDMFKEFGIKKLLGIKGFKHTTNNSVVVTEDPTCTVDQESAVLTVPAGSDNDMRVYMLIGV